MATKEYTVKTSDKEKVARILNNFSEVRIIGEEKDEKEEMTEAACEEKKNRYRILAGKARELGEDLNELEQLSTREEPWRHEEE
ncbi:hypothetical protein [Planococcus lenghuensis]|uniref:Uncharacterized protein n=1 Tax=Planococcus lenghuensis TaxID=2213202 RepID=A0A1Q2L236_9BACL|nr:hypothetical protein [Planococcus lenghuensis]AQQ54107.1 hypothetical protein B0X71_14000 [Planococcus lenghuensis]